MFVRVVIASLTVSAGLNISATCVLFNGFGREKETVSDPRGKFFDRQKVLDGSESMNVAGRAGRAYVDTHGEVLGLCFNAQHKKAWERLRAGMSQQSFTSGLAAVLDRLITLLQHDNVSAEAVRNMIAMSADGLWAQPPVKEDNLTRWAKATQALDQALLSFVGNLEVDLQQLAACVDESLKSSFFGQRLGAFRMKILTCLFIPAGESFGETTRLSSEKDGIMLAWV